MTIPVSLEGVRLSKSHALVDFKLPQALFGIELVTVSLAYGEKITIEQLQANAWKALAVAAQQLVDTASQSGPKVDKGRDEPAVA